LITLTARLSSFTPMDEDTATLQVLIADERDDRLDLIRETVVALGHDVIARTTSLDDLGPLSRRVHADVALIGIGLDGEHALAMISAIVQEAACPVVALLDTDDAAMITEAAKRGVFAYVILNGRPQDLANALDITLRRFAEFINLQGAFGRRALIEQAKGILMARNGIDADEAYKLLKHQSQATGRKLVDIAEAVTQSHLLIQPARDEQ
jgi:AmiR/NasT family two-component response regulator